MGGSLGGGLSHSLFMGMDRGEIEAEKGHNTGQGLGLLVLLVGELNLQGPPGASVSPASLTACSPPFRCLCFPLLLQTCHSPALNISLPGFAVPHVGYFGGTAQHQGLHLGVETPNPPFGLLPTTLGTNDFPLAGATRAAEPWCGPAAPQALWDRHMVFLSCSCCAKHSMRVLWVSINPQR